MQEGGHALKTLVADDDRDLLELIGFTLAQAGYLVVKASDGVSALRTFEDESPDLVVLDINMPGASGFQVCEAIRKRSRVPVIMLTVRGEEEDLVRALDLGADDYLTKPFSPRTLLARIKALLRRAGMESSAPLAAGRVKLDIEEHTVRIGDSDPIRLTKLELRLLQMLLANAGHTVSSDRLLIQVWGHRNSGDRQLLKQLVHRLRQKIEADPAQPRLLQTASGAGYKLVVD
jgi:DNA-binding response OmpR family regulator